MQQLLLGLAVMIRASEALYWRTHGRNCPSEDDKTQNSRPMPLDFLKGSNCLAETSMTNLCIVEFWCKWCSLI